VGVTAANVDIPWSLNAMITGSGTSHTINLCYYTGANTGVILNASGYYPTMTFNLTQSN
jgi:hypothetical protein